VGQNKVPEMGQLSLPKAGSKRFHLIRINENLMFEAEREAQKPLYKVRVLKSSKPYPEFFK
jgi:hypothetical protein